MEALSLHTPDTHSAILDTVSQPEPSTTFLKMEDIHHSADASPAPSISAFSPPATTSTSQSSPPPVVVQSRPAKKRKSWGQELPEPKTSLPPRKRAKTDDEKEQRRIERIKRNRAAAHNSRERKRQETETLAVALARANAELEAYRKLHGPLPSNIVLPEVRVDRSEESADQTASTPAPSLVDSHGSQADATSPPSPADDIFHSHPTIKQEPLDTPFQPTFSPAFDNLDAKSSLHDLDLTQHSAVSVQPHMQHDFGSYLVEQSLSLPDGYSASDMLPDYPGSALDAFAFSNGADDASFNAPLFEFDDLISDDATFAVDAQTSGAA